MRQLTAGEIERLASRKGARRIAVENFLGSMDPAISGRDHLKNLFADVAAYRWSSSTQHAIAAGIRLALHG